MEVAGVDLPHRRHPGASLQAAYAPLGACVAALRVPGGMGWTAPRVRGAAETLHLALAFARDGAPGSTPATSPGNAKTPPDGGALLIGGGGSRTRVLIRVPWTSTGLAGHCFVGDRLAAQRAAIPYPGCSHLPPFGPRGRPASIATETRPLKAAQPISAFYRLRGESVTVVVGS